MAFRVVVDEAACTGHGRCYDLVPEVFGSDDYGHSVVLVPDVEGDLLAGARRAVASCPEQAISIVES
jgi:ferredoxin